MEVEPDTYSRCRKEAELSPLEAYRRFPQTAPNVSECSERFQKTPGSRGGLVHLQQVWKKRDCHVIVVDDLFVVFRSKACKGRAPLLGGPLHSSCQSSSLERIAEATVNNEQ